MVRLSEHTLKQRSSLHTVPVTALKGVGPKIRERLGRLGIHSIQDLLFHLPLRYEDRTRVARMGSLCPGDVVVLHGMVRGAFIGYGRRRSLSVEIADESGSVYLRFFHFSAVQQRALRRGAEIQCFGEVRQGPRSLELVHPAYKLITPHTSITVEQCLTPVYSTTAGLTQSSFRKLTALALSILNTEDGLPEYLPQSILERRSLPPIKTALELVHRPPPDTSLAELSSPEYPARRRLIFEELVSHHLSLCVLREQHSRQHAPPLHADGILAERFAKDLPFTLTDSQRGVIEQIRSDLGREHPMYRLLQGDVGCGKTVVAAFAAVHAVEAGFQVALMAPTELLAEQHAGNLREWLEPLGVEFAWLKGTLSASDRETALTSIASGRATLAVGTHALFQERVEFARLGLIIVDEQQRFGVHQRFALRSKGIRQGLHPHQLIMTATPIPRTLAMTVYGQLNTSVIDTLPPGRIPVSTAVLPSTRRTEVIEKVRKACTTGGQAYWVCTSIETSEEMECETVLETSEMLQHALPQLRVGLVHGRMQSADKEKVMSDFKAGDISLVVATTVIEVGVDVPNATLMVIENAERLGLAQLHQLRGRIGRGNRAGVCVMMYRSPLSDHARARLSILRKTHDGFEIAGQDLALRGPGEFLGTQQTGIRQFRIADLVRDAELLPDVQRVASELMMRYPHCVSLLIERWLGKAEDYIGV